MACLGGQGEPEGVPEVVGAQRADVAGGVGLFTVVPASDLFADQVDRARGQSPVGSAGADRGRGQEQGGGARARVGRAFVLEVVGQGRAGVGGDEHVPGGPALALHSGDLGLLRRPQGGGGVRADLVQVEGDQLLAAQAGGSSR